MIYGISKIVFKKACSIFFRKITIIGDQTLIGTRPVILALNHPNSFLDAIVTSVLVESNGGIYSLARGDAFKNKFLAKILATYKMIPIYRISEGKDNVEKNFETFDAAQQILQSNGTILIFSEGLCENNWRLRPMKKGTARMAKEAWLNPDTANAMVIPVGLTYEHFSGAGKSLIINYGEPIVAADFKGSDFQGSFTNDFNQLLGKRLNSLAYIDDSLVENSERHKKFMSNWSSLEKKHEGVAFLTELKKEIPTTSVFHKKLLPSKIHQSIILIPHYSFCKWLTYKITKGNLFYDSILLGVLVFLLPVYLLLIFFIGYCLILNFI